MKISKMAFATGALMAAVAGMSVVACSSSDNNPSNNQDAGASTDSGAVTTPADTGAPSNNDAGTPPTTCAKPPSLHAPSATGVYCPFSWDNATDAGVKYCSGSTPQCCVSPSSDAGISDCEGTGYCKDATFKQWQCSAPSDCAGVTSDAGGPVVCCLVSGAVEPDPNCNGFQKTKGLGSVTCKAASQCQGTIQVNSFSDVQYVACESQADCAASAAAFGGDGGTCTPVKTSGTPIGLCL
jgi:hypothetical protein